MGEAVVYCVAHRGAFLRSLGRTARQRLLKFLSAFWGLTLAALLLSRAGLGQSAVNMPVDSSGGAESSRPAACEHYLRAGAGPRQSSDSGDTVLLAEAEGPFRLGRSAVRIPLRPVSTTTPEEGLLISRLDALKRGRSIYLVVRDLHTEVQPGVLYNVYLDLPAGAKPDKNDPHYVGLLNFFNSAYGNPAPRPDFFFSYDITSVARKLRARKLLAGRTTITVSPAGAPEGGSAPIVGRVELVEQ